MVLEITHGYNCMPGARSGSGWVDGCCSDGAEIARRLVGQPNGLRVWGSGFPSLWVKAIMLLMTSHSRVEMHIIQREGEL